MQAAEQHGMDSNLAVKKVKKRRAPAPPNPFTGEVEDEDKDGANPFEDDEEAEPDFDEVRQ